MRPCGRLTVFALAVLTSAALSACGNGDDAGSSQEKTDHVWKDKTGAIDKARDVQRQLDESRKQ